MNIKLQNGHYKTSNGSEMWISGNSAGISSVAFDWVEEGGCPECRAQAYEDDGHMVWDCNYCNGGSAELVKQ